MSIYPVPTSLNPVYLFFGSSVETGILGNALRTFLSNSFSERIKGGSWGISVVGPTGYQGLLVIGLSGYSRSVNVFLGLGSGFRKQSGPKTLGIS